MYMLLRLVQFVIVCLIVGEIIKTIAYNITLQRKIQTQKLWVLRAYMLLIEEQKNEYMKKMYAEIKEQLSSGFLEIGEQNFIEINSDPNKQLEQWLKVEIGLIEEAGGIVFLKSKLYSRVREIAEILKLIYSEAKE